MPVIAPFSLAAPARPDLRLRNGIGHGDICGFLLAEEGNETDFAGVEDAAPALQGDTGTIEMHEMLSFDI